MIDGGVVFWSVVVVGLLTSRDSFLVGIGVLLVICYLV